MTKDCLHYISFLPISQIKQNHGNEKKIRLKK